MKSKARRQKTTGTSQQAKQAAKAIGGCAAYQRKVTDQILKVCAMFGGTVQGVAL